MPSISEFFYDPHDHYWIVPTHPGEVYSSSRDIYVPTNDSLYLAFLADKFPTTIANEEELRQVLSDAGIPYLGQRLFPLQDARPRVASARLQFLEATTFAVKNNEPKAIPWTSVTVDPLTMWSDTPNPEFITIRESGGYRFSINVQFVEATASGLRLLQLAVGDPPTELASLLVPPSLIGDSRISFVNFADLIEGDIVRVFLNQTSGAPVEATARANVVRVE